MGSTDGNPAPIAFKGKGSHSGSPDEPTFEPSAGAPDAARPEAAATAVNQIADSFREMLMRAVETTNPSQLAALTNMVSTMGLQAGDGVSQQEIDKMAKTLSSLSVGRLPQEPAHQSSSAKSPQQKMPQAHSRASRPMGQGDRSTGQPAAKPEPLSTEAQQVNDALQSLKLQGSTHNHEPEKESTSTFRFRAVSPDLSAQPGLDLGGSSRKSPLRPAPSRPASRRTRQRPSSQPDGSTQQPSRFGAQTSFGSPPLNDASSESKFESRHADIMKAALREMDGSGPDPRASHSFARHGGSTSEDVSMEPEMSGESDPAPVEAGASLPPQPPLPSFPSTRQPAAPKPFESRASRAQSSHPVAPFPKLFTQTKPHPTGATAPPPDLFTAGISSQTRAATSVFHAMDSSPLPSDVPPAVPFPLRFGNPSVPGLGPANIHAPGQAAAERSKPINPFSPASPTNIRVQRSPPKGTALNGMGQPPFGATQDGTAATPPALDTSEPSSAMFSAGSTGVPLQPTSPPILAFTAARPSLNRPIGVNEQGSREAPPQRQRPQQLSSGAAATHTNGSQNVQSFTAAEPAAAHPFAASQPFTTSADTGAGAREAGARETGRGAAAGESIPAWPSFVPAGPSSPEIKSGSGGAAAAAGSTFGSAFHPGVCDQEGLTGSGRTPPSGRGRKPKHHALRNRTSPSVSERKNTAQRQRRESVHALGESPKASSADPGSPFAMGAHNNLASVRATDGASDQAAPPAETPTSQPWQPPNQQQQPAQWGLHRQTEHVDSDSTDSNDSARMAQPTAAVPLRHTASTRRAARAAGHASNDREPTAAAAAPAASPAAPHARATTRPTGMATMEFVFGGQAEQQSSFGQPSWPLHSDSATSQPPQTGASASTFYAPTPVGQRTPQIRPEASHVSPMSTAPPFHPHVDNPFAKSSESSQSKMFSPMLKFTATPPSAGLDGAAQPKVQPHSHRPRHFNRRRNSSSMGGTDQSTSPAANTPIDASRASEVKFVPLHGKSSPVDASKSVPAGTVPFHTRAKENNSPRSNSGSGAAPRGTHPASQAGALPVPQDALNAACEHRNRGNALFKQKKYPEAEYEYSAALKALLVHKQRHPSDVKPRQIAVFYSNRAAAKLMLNRPQDALPDCHAALEADETYRRALERAASCHRRMGNLKKAEEVLAQAVAASATAPSVTADDKAALASRLAEVRQLQDEVKELWAAVATATSPESLAKLNKDTAKLLSQLQDCPRARILRAAAQLRCGAWDGACSSAAAAGEWPSSRIKLQAWWINCECLYAQGDLDRCVRRLESGLDMLCRLEAEDGSGGVVVQREDDCLPLPASSRVQELASKIHTVLRCKQQGNNAFQQKDYPEAERQYTAALAVREVAAPAFYAVLYSNRAAVHMEQKQWVDALADCGRARALNPSFHRVLRRLSKIHEELGRPGQAAECLQELKTLGTHSSTDTSELHRSIMQLNAKKRMDGSPHHFRMLNVATSAAVPELKTAFRKLAVQYHPDKALAGCAATCSLSGSVTAARDDGLHTRLRTSANELFQLVNEAWETLQDSSKRQMCRMEHDEDYLHRDDAFAFMYDNLSTKFPSSFASRRRW